MVWYLGLTQELDACSLATTAPSKPHVGSRNRDLRVTAVYFKQNVQGVPVYNSRLQVLVRNESGYPAVSIGTDLQMVNPSRRPGLQPLTDEMSLPGPMTSCSDVVIVSEPEMVGSRGI